MWRRSCEPPIAQRRTKRTIFQWRPARGFMGLASARRIVARRIPPPCRVSEREIASAPWENKPFRKPRGEGARSLSRGAIQVGGTNRFGYHKNKSKIPLGIGYLLKQIKSTVFFGYLIKTHSMTLIPYWGRIILLLQHFLRLNLTWPKAISFPRSPLLHCEF